MLSMNLTFLDIWCSLSGLVFVYTVIAHSVLYPSAYIGSLLITKMSDYSPLELSIDEPVHYKYHGTSSVQTRHREGSSQSRGRGVVIESLLCKQCPKKAVENAVRKWQCTSIAPER